jgi:hypothetical protein
MKTNPPVETTLLSDTKAHTKPASERPARFCESEIIVAFSLDVDHKYKITGRCDVSLADSERAICIAQTAFVQSLRNAPWGRGKTEDDYEHISFKLEGWFIDNTPDTVTTTVASEALSFVEPKEIVLTGFDQICADLVKKVQSHFLATLAALKIPID